LIQKTKMRLVLVLTLLALSVAVLSNDVLSNFDEIDVEGQRMVDWINAQDAGWTAEYNPEVYRRLVSGEKYFNLRKDGKSEIPVLTINSLADPPTSFDSRTQWPGCIGRVLDQGRCGSCWAFGTTETLSDRFCIHSSGSIMVQLAALDLTTCDDQQDGCNGGDPYSAWLYAKKTGIVTEACAMYNKSIPTCAPVDEPCLNFVPTPKCPAPTCDNGANWNDDKHFAQSAYSINANIVDIESDMVTNGPVQAAFNVYQDFIHYKSGVYRHLTGQYLGGHSVKMIGYGTQNSTDYWLVQNSWTTTWGDEGYFMILRGKDECGIEDGVCAGMPKISS